nr:LLM class flavin-dependent oxidoreductase [Propionibacterium sp.]
MLDLSFVAQGQSTADALSATLDLARAADRLGCVRFWTAEHHNMGSVAATSPGVLIAALGAATTRIRVGSGGVMLPNHSPYVVAEQFAVLEALYPGRVDLGIGRAPGTDPLTAWALRRGLERDGVDDFAEHVQLIRAWLSPQGVQAGNGRELAVTPHATSYPEVWLLGSSDFSARLAGRLGLRYAYAGHFGELDPAAVVELYRRGFEPSAELAQPFASVCVSAITAPTDAEAQFLAGPARHRWLGLRQGRREPLVAPEEAARLLGPGAHRLAGVNHVGTPDAVASAINALVERAGADEIMIAGATYDVATRIDTLRSLTGAA